MDKYIEQFKSFINHFITPTKNDYDLILPYLTLKQYKKKEQVIIAGDQCNTLYFICDGFHYIYENHDGNHITKDFLKENDFFTDFPSVLGGTTSKLNVSCIEDSHILTLPYNILNDAYKKSHNISEIGRLMVERAFTEHVLLSSSRK